MLRFRRIDRSQELSVVNSMKLSVYMTFPKVPRRQLRSREQAFIVLAEPAGIARVSRRDRYSQWSNQWIANT